MLKLTRSQRMSLQGQVIYIGLTQVEAHCTALTFLNRIGAVQQPTKFSAYILPTMVEPLREALGFNMLNGLPKKENV